MGYKTVAEMERRMTSREYAGWTAFYRMEPWGCEAEWLHTANVLAMLANVNRDPKRRSRPYKAADFMPKFGSRPKRTSADELQGQFRAIFGALKAGPGK